MLILMFIENTDLQPPSSITQGATTTTSVSVSWSQVSNGTGYYVSYQRQDLGAPPVVTPQYERIVGGDNTSVTLSGLEPGTTYRIRVWSTDGTSVSSGTREMDVTTVESGEISLGKSLSEVPHMYRTLHILTTKIESLINPYVFMSYYDHICTVLRVTCSPLLPCSSIPTTHADHNWKYNIQYC